MSTDNMDRERVEKAAEEYAIKTQEHLKKHLGYDVIPAWGPVAGGFTAGVEWRDANPPQCLAAKGYDFDAPGYWAFLAGDRNGSARMLKEIVGWLRSDEAHQLRKNHPFNPENGPTLMAGSAWAEAIEKKFGGK
jgi:hypothetical protein